MIDYKAAYQSLNKDYTALLKEREERASLPLLQHWLRNDIYRGSANICFTEGPERQIAYEIENMLSRLKDGVYITSYPTKKLGNCPRCGYCSDPVNKK